MGVMAGRAWLRLAVARIEVVDRSDEMGGAFGGLNGMNGRHLEIIPDDHDGGIVRQARVRDEGVRDVHLGGFINEEDIEAGHQPLTAQPAELVRRPANNGDQVRLSQSVAHGAEGGGVPAGDVRAEPFIHAAWCRGTGSQARERHRIVPSLSRTYLGQFRRHIIDRHPCRTGDANPDAVTRTARLPDETGDARRSRLALARAGRPPPDRQPRGHRLGDGGPLPLGEARMHPGKVLQHRCCRAGSRFACQAVRVPEEALGGHRRILPWST